MAGRNNSTPLVAIAQELCDRVSVLRFAEPVSYVYNPLEYAWETHRQYLERYGKGPKEVLFLGMNPGPWGMAQTGVPFGEVGAVSDWLGISGTVGKPAREHPKRPVLGLSCSRSEVSGARLWGWAKERFGTAERFAERFFVANYCPLAFMEEGGKNRTPDKLPAGEREPLLQACDEALRKTVALLEPQWIVGVGAYAEAQALRALEGLEVRIGKILHPSPASPIANRGWAQEADKQLAELGIALPGAAPKARGARNQKR